MQKIFYNRVNLSASLLISLTLFLAFTANAQSSTEIVRRSLNKGVNLSFLEHYWTNPSLLYEKQVNDKLKDIARKGFRAVRLPVAFDHFAVDNDTQLSSEILQKLHQIYARCLQLNLKLILVYHYGRLRNDNLYVENDRIIRMWKQVMQSMRSYPTDQLVYELYNEPTTDMDIWKSAATTLVRELRKEDQNRIFIIGGANYNGINELLHMGKLPVDDGKIIYTFHFYEPYIFTHQGADWTPEKTYLTGFPYPYNEKSMPKPPAENDYSPLAKDYWRYNKEATGYYLQNRIQQISAQAKKLNLPLICTETGVINFADIESKSNYLSDITSVMNEMDIPVVLWDYDDKFSIIQHKKIIRALKKWLK
jgi:endoglucanase